MKIAVIGCGYVGAAAAAFWQQAGHELTVTTTSADRLQLLQKRFGKALLLKGHQPEDWSDALLENEAILLSVAPSASTDYENTYLRTAQHLAALLKAPSAVSQILYTSSTSVYGSHEGQWVVETSPLLASSPQAKILMETEKTLLETTTKTRKAVIFRLSEIYGPEREIQKRLMRHQGTPIAGDGSNYTNLIHVDDVVRALDFALSNQLEGIYNLCSDFHLTRREFYDRLCETHHLEKITWDPSLHSHHGGNRKVSNEKIKNAGFTFHYPEYLC